ncbi:MAG: GIY-YIG nuclease family protein [Alphaproteobacteria bacterium]|nr:GIY-YIG nuclease family protein [Alphaproteobacteria bacterium]MCB9929746.1 GIY-YIG nuclease family protein [Alphaproteobacteria bacterium]
MPACVYMLASQKNGTLYIGSTTDLARRVQDHRDKVLDGFTKRYGVTRLVYVEAFPTVFEARQRERQIKNWRRSWKINLIEAQNPHWEDLVKFL